MKKSHLFIKTIVLSWFYVLSINAVQAAVTYQYIGNNYTFAESPYDTSMSISGSFAVDSPLINVSGEITTQIISFSFSDGINTITKAETDGRFLFDTDASGDIINWEISLFVIPPIIGETGTDIFTRGVPTVSGFSSFDTAGIQLCTSAAFGECLNYNFIASANFIQIDNPGAWSSVIPVPPSVWLFGSGLLGLVGLARRKKAT